MNKKIQVFMEYKIKGETLANYEAAMSSILKELERNGASDIKWFEAADQHHLYVEMYTVPSMEEYQMLKVKRRDSDHPVFGQLQSVIDGGLEKLHCWAFIEKNTN